LWYIKKKRKATAGEFRKMSRKDRGRRSSRRKKQQSAQNRGLSVRKKLLIGLGVAAAIAIIVVVARMPAPEGDNVLSSQPQTYSAPPAMTIDTSKQYTATIETEKGDLVLELFASDVPVTVNNFVFLAREGFYDGLTFHRVVADFVVQGGDPIGDGTGGPGYEFDDEFTEHTHVAGALSMANSGPNTNGSQFFITFTPQHHLDGVHSVFGQLIEGMDVLESIEQGDVMIRVTIDEK
jgi:peptidyl-prolyl cis-trans isomerase B (cyclophilin B)